MPKGYRFAGLSEKAENDTGFGDRAVPLAGTGRVSCHLRSSGHEGAWRRQNFDDRAAFGPDTDLADTLSYLEVNSLETASRGSAVCAIFSTYRRLSAAMRLCTRDVVVPVSGAGSKLWRRSLPHLERNNSNTKYFDILDVDAVPETSLLGARRDHAEEHHMWILTSVMLLRERQLAVEALGGHGGASRDLVQKKLSEVQELGQWRSTRMYTTPARNRKLQNERAARVKQDFVMSFRITNFTLTHPRNPGNTDMGVG